MNFPAVLKTIAAFFESEGFEYGVIGAFALHAYGLSRATSDLDFVTVVEAQSRLIPFLEGRGYETLHRSSGYSNHLHEDPALGRLDFVYVSGETSQLLFSTAKKTLRMGDLSIPVPRPEHLAAMKIQALKNDPTRTFQEMADIQFLMGLPGVDEAEIRSYFERKGLLGIYDEIKKILGTA